VFAVDDYVNGTSDYFLRYSKKIRNRPTTPREYVLKCIFIKNHLYTVQIDVNKNVSTLYDYRSLISLWWEGEIFLKLLIHSCVLTWDLRRVPLDFWCYFCNRRSRIHPTMDTSRQSESFCGTPSPRKIDTLSNGCKRL